MNREKKTKALIRYYLEVIGKSPSKKQIETWNSLNDYSFLKIYVAWQNLYYAVAISA